MRGLSYKTSGIWIINANHGGCICIVFSVNTLFLFRKGAGDDDRRGLSLFKNMPFLHIEDALLEARRVSSLTLYVTH